MSLERADYRDNLEDILAYTNGRRLLNVSEVAEYLGVCRDTVRKRFGIDANKGVSAPTLARLLSQLPAERRA